MKVGGEVTKRDGDGGRGEVGVVLEVLFDVAIERNETVFDFRRD